MYVVIQTDTQDHLDSVSVMRNYLATDSISSQREEDAILRKAVEEALGILGEPIKTYLLLKIGLTDEDGNDLDQAGVLEYDGIVEQLTVIFGSSGSVPILHHLDKKIAEQRASRTDAN